ncbi:MAG: rhodanese-like domain-containing protein [Chloroflexi bacterium]|nr:rhodanese-like domain-containing protein [Chloroflexota bacterium]
MARQEPGEPYTRISVEEAKKMLEEGDAVVVDVRQPNEYTAGHVKGALFIPVDSVLGRFDELPKDKKLLFICAVGVRSGLACEMAAAMGISSEQLFNIEDGTPTWIEKKLPTSFGMAP